MVEIGPELFWSESELVEFVGLPCPIIALLEECSVIIVIEVVELEPGLEVSELICNQRKNKKILVVSFSSRNLYLLPKMMSSPLNPNWHELRKQENAHL